MEDFELLANEVYSYFRRKVQNAAHQDWDYEVTEVHLHPNQTLSAQMNQTLSAQMNQTLSARNQTNHTLRAMEDFELLANEVYSHFRCKLQNAAHQDWDYEVT